MKGAIIMTVKQKTTADEKIRIAKLCLSGKLSQGEAARQVGVSKTAVQSWIAKYKFQGELGFKELENNLTYSTELKQNAVIDYLTESKVYMFENWKNGKLNGTAKIRKKTLLSWIDLFFLDIEDIKKAGK